MKFHILTLFPDMIIDALSYSIMARAIDSGRLEVNAVDIRAYSAEKHGSVDDYPYGGGAGMVMQAQPIYDAYRAVCRRAQKDLKVIYMTPQGRVFDQPKAKALSLEDELVILCGHYEGVDERVLAAMNAEFLSVGDYVLTGGELPALIVIDAVSRLAPGVLHNSESAVGESFEGGLLEYPQYSRPRVWEGRGVPPILLSGNHAAVDEYRLKQSIERTEKYRPDLLEAYYKDCNKKP